MGIHDHDSAECPGCVANERTHPNRVYTPAGLCYSCSAQATKDAAHGLDDMKPFLGNHLGFTDYLIEHPE